MSSKTVTEPLPAVAVGSRQNTRARLSEITSAALRGNAALWGYVEQHLCSDDLTFLSRVYADGVTKYYDRLAGLGFDGLGNVVDAGCGLGQWSFALAHLCRRVRAVDVAPDRIDACRRIAQEFGIDGIRFDQVGLERLPYGNGTFDGAVSYSVLYLTDFPVAIHELGRVLCPNGLLYVSTNNIGRYLLDILRQPSRTTCYNPRRYGLLTVWNTLRRRRCGLSGDSGAIVMPRVSTVRALEAAGFEVMAIGAEGSLGGGSRPFVPHRFLGLECTYDILARKR